MPLANPAISIEVHPMSEKPGYYKVEVVSMSGEPYGKGKQTYRMYAADVSFHDVLSYANAVVTGSKLWTNAFCSNLELISFLLFYILYFCIQEVLPIKFSVNIAVMI